MTADLLLTDLHAATMAGGADPYGTIGDAGIAITGDRVSWVGPASGAPGARRSRSLGGRWVTPGLVDCHTHLLFGGNRAGEFEERLSGVTYEEMAARGGGIASTVAATRSATDEELLRSAATRARWLAVNGATTIEVKSGYGLDVATELRMLRLARRIAESVPVTVVTTLLGAHTVPPEFREDRGGYVDLVCEEMIPAAAAEGLADAVDVFCDTVGFDLAETERVLDAAVANGLSTKAHAGQLSDLGGAAAAAARGAISVDHLEHVDEAGIAAMAASGSVAVLLPGASYLLAEETLPPVERFRAAGVAMAVSTDLNPGTSPLASLPLACSLAVNRFGLTPAEAVAGVTRNAAAALGMSDEIGVVAPGMRADLAVWDVESPGELAYWIGASLCHATLRAGVVTVWDGERGEVLP